MIEVNLVIAAMLAIVNQHGLKLMRYAPRDLNVHDREVLKRIAVKGGCAAWVVGDMHCQLVELGVTQQQNQMVTYLTNYCSSDRFYRIDFGFGKDGFTFTEIGRDAFRALSNVPLKYTQKGYSHLDFTLLRTYRGEHRADEEVGSVSITCLDAIKHEYELVLMPKAGATKLDRSALYAWGADRIAAHGTLFAKWNLLWVEQMQVELEAA